MVPVDLSTEMVFPGVPSSQRDGNSAPWHSVTQPPRVTGGYAASPRVTAMERAPHERAMGLVTLTMAEEEPHGQGRAR